jgi:hypothetical protein
MELTTENVGVTTSHPATPLEMEAAAASVQPKAAERVHFARPGKFQQEVTARSRGCRKQHR